MKFDHYQMLEAFNAQDIGSICNTLKAHFGISFDADLAEVVIGDPHYIKNEITLFVDKAFYSWSDTEGFHSHDFLHPLMPLLRICFAMCR